MPSVLGWYAEDSFSLIPVRACEAFQNLEVNSLSQSETMSRGRLFSQYQLSKNMTARSSAR